MEMLHGYNTKLSVSSKTLVKALIYCVLFPGGQASTVSWDHFFASFSQYLASLRQELPSGVDPAHIYRHAHHRGITPQELDGLVSVLQLMRCIAEQVTCLLYWFA
jgi:hypothetical protein